MPSLSEDRPPSSGDSQGAARPGLGFLLTLAAFLLMAACLVMSFWHHRSQARLQAQKDFYQPSSSPGRASKPVLEIHGAALR